MKIAQILGFTAVATGVHLGAFWGLQTVSSSGSSGAGNGGENALTLASVAGADVLVDAWEAKPTSTVELNLPAPHTPLRDEDLAELTVSKSAEVSFQGRTSDLAEPEMPKPPPRVTTTLAETTLASASPVSDAPTLLREVPPAPPMEDVSSFPRSVPPTPKPIAPTIGMQPRETLNTPTRNRPIEADIAALSRSIRPPARPADFADRSTAQTPASQQVTRRDAGVSSRPITNRAAGHGQTRMAGANTRLPAPSLSSAQINQKMADWGAQIRSEIERRRPNLREKGVLTLRITLEPSGALLSASLTRSSGLAQLDTAALQTLRAIPRFPRAPTQLNQAAYTFNVPIRFR